MIEKTTLAAISQDIENNDALALYDIALDSESVAFLEKIKTSEIVDIYVMNSKKFQSRFLDFLAERYRTSLPFNHEDTEDKLGKNYSQIRFTTEFKPKIISTFNAFPCSIVFACDQMGNAVLAHMTQFLLFAGNDKQRADQSQLASKTTGNITQFINSNLSSSRLLLITATNLDTQLRSEIADSIINNIHSDEPIVTGCVFTAEGNHIDSRANVPEGKLRTTEDLIDGIYFLPKQITANGRNVLILVGDDAKSKSDSFRAWEWRSSLR